MGRACSENVKGKNDFNILTGKTYKLCFHFLCCIKQFNSLYLSPDYISVIKSTSMSWAGHIARIGEGKTALNILTGKNTGTQDHNHIIIFVLSIPYTFKIRIFPRRPFVLHKSSGVFLNLKIIFHRLSCEVTCSSWGSRTSAYSSNRWPTQFIGGQEYELVSSADSSLSRM